MATYTLLETYTPHPHTPARTFQPLGMVGITTPAGRDTPGGSAGRLGADDDDDCVGRRARLAAAAAASAALRSAAAAAAALSAVTVARPQIAVGEVAERRRWI